LLNYYIFLQLYIMSKTKGDEEIVIFKETNEEKPREFEKRIDLKNAHGEGYNFEREDGE